MVNGVSIEVKNLFKSFGETKAVDGISFKVIKGSIFGMLGPNGAGKSTTIELLVGHQSSDSGWISILGLDPGKDKKHLKKLIGVQLQSPALFGKLKVKEMISLFASFYSHPLLVQDVIDMVSLREKENTYTDSLSGGQRHRLAIALAIVGNGELIFLDEPTTGLDPQSRRNLWDVIALLKKKGKTIFLTTHYMDEAERLCDDLLIIDRGRVIAKGSPIKLIKEHFHENAIEFSNPSLNAEEIEGLGHLFGVTRKTILPEGSILLYTKEAGSTLGDLLEYIKGLGKTLDGIYVRRPTLEDLFLKLTGRKIRE